MMFFHIRHIYNKSSNDYEHPGIDGNQVMHKLALAHANTGWPWKDSLITHGTSRLLCLRVWTLEERILKSVSAFNGIIYNYKQKIT
jgi:hypothetical protein